MLIERFDLEILTLPASLGSSTVLTMDLAMHDRRLALQSLLERSPRR